MKRFNEKNLLEFDPNSSPQDIKEGLAIPGNGKGDSRRGEQISSQQLARNWCRTFGHKRWNYSNDSCRDCGMIREEQIFLAGKEAPRTTTA